MPAASPTALEPAIAATAPATPVSAPLALAPTPAALATPPTEVAPGAEPPNTSTTVVSPGEPALASVAPSKPVQEPKRRTVSELRDAVRDALRDQGMSNVEVRVEPDGRVHLTNLRDDAEAARARTVAGSVSDEPLLIETSVHATKRQDRRASRLQAAEHEDTAPHVQTDAPKQSAPAWEIHRSGAEQTD